jgi:hypothetical protein
VVSSLRGEDLRRAARDRLEIRTLIAALRRRHAGEDAPAEGVRWGYGRFVDVIRANWGAPDFGVGRAFPWVLAAKDKLEAGDTVGFERIALEAAWNSGTRCELGHAFDYEAVIFYVLRWSLNERWARYDADAAGTRFAGLLDAAFENYEPEVPGRSMTDAPVAHISAVQEDIVRLRLSTPGVGQLVKNEVVYIVPARTPDQRLKAEVLRVLGTPPTRRCSRAPAASASATRSSRPASCCRSARPGHARQVYDGLQNPLEALAVGHGVFLPRGVEAPGLDPTPGGRSPRAGGSATRCAPATPSARCRRARSSTRSWCPSISTRSSRSPGSGTAH